MSNQFGSIRLIANDAKCSPTAFDDQSSTFAVPSRTGFEVIFCPGGRSTNILAALSSQTQSPQLQDQGQDQGSYLFQSGPRRLLAVSNNDSDVANGTDDEEEGGEGGSDEPNESRESNPDQDSKEESKTVMKPFKTLRLRLRSGANATCSPSGFFVRRTDSLWALVIAVGFLLGAFDGLVPL